MSQMTAMNIEPRTELRVGPRIVGLTRRMVEAEFLKVRKRRGLVAWSVILTVGVVALVFGVMAIQHAENPVRYGPAGGVSHLATAMGILATLGSVAAITVGAAVGAGDLQAGVFRDLVSTGRSRVALFAARVPGGLMLLWPLLAVAWSVACLAAVAFAGGLPAPSVSAMVQGGGWVLLATTCNYLLAMAIGSVSGARSAAIGVALGWQFVVSSLLMGTSGLGPLRQGLQMAALTRLIPAGLRESEPDAFIAAMSVGLAILVMISWALVGLAAGAWSTKNRDA